MKNKDIFISEKTTRHLRSFFTAIAKNLLIVSVASILFLATIGIGPPPKPQGKGPAYDQNFTCYGLFKNKSCGFTESLGRNLSWFPLFIRGAYDPRIPLSWFNYILITGLFIYQIQKEKKSKQANE